MKPAPIMRIVEIHDDMRAAVKAFLANRNGFRDANNWDGLFGYPWKLPQYPYGYAVMDDDRIVAFLGTIFSERLIQGRKRLCCSITTWFVEEQYRRQKLATGLLDPIFKMDGVLILGHTPSPASMKLLQKEGFHPLEHTQIAVPILPVIRWFDNGKKPLVTFDKDEIEANLDKENRKIFADHAALQCKHFLIRENNSGQLCYGIVIAAPLDRLRILKGQSLNLCYISNGGVFKRNFGSFCRQSWKEGRFLLLRYDARLLPDKLSRIRLQDERIRMYKSVEPVSWIVDNLYSELVTFNKY